jgi:hypothetical protein
MAARSDEYTRSSGPLMRKERKPEVYNALKIGQDDHGGFLARMNSSVRYGSPAGANIFRQNRARIHYQFRRPQDPLVPARARGLDCEEAAYPESDDTFVW